MDAADLLRVEGLDAGYGGITALRDVSLRVGRGQFVALLGANGAGKSTLLKCVFGTHRPDRGRVLLHEQDVTGTAAWRRIRAGLAYVPEGRDVVAPLTVEENLGLTWDRSDSADRLAMAYDYFPRLGERRRQKAGLLSGGEQQMLAVARALATRPDILLLDEPSMGLAPSIVDVVYEAIARLHADGIGVLLVEQDATRAMGLADRVYVLNRGVIDVEGTADAVQDDPRLRSAYLG